MSKLPSSNKIIKVLLNQDFNFVSQKGSHRKYKKDSRIVIVPHPKKQIPIGTFRSIVRQSGLDINLF
ncbi:MAG: addiction module toxin, HicA family [Chlorobi bacterium]|nr:addiction module toxin, HicA family [Chlorobiota bacterium]